MDVYFKIAGLILSGLCLSIFVSGCDINSARSRSSDSVAAIAPDLSAESNLVHEVFETGVFIDSPVKGLAYQTELLSGTTNEQGEFNYFAGETIEFFVGDISIGESIANRIVTPDDLVSKNRQHTVNHRRNLIRFLQTLDSDSEPSNGIEINAEVAGRTHNIVLDFDLPVDQFERLTGLATLLAEATNAGTLVSEFSALRHYRRSLASHGIELPSSQLTKLDFVGNLDAGEVAPYTESRQIIATGAGINRPVISSVNNGYREQVFLISNPDGAVTEVQIDSGESAVSIAEKLNAVQGVYASSSNSIDIDFGRLSEINTLGFWVNGMSFPYSSSINDIAIEVNYQAVIRLSGITAIDNGTVLTLKADSGVDLEMINYGGVSGSDRLVFTGTGGTATMTSTIADQTLSVGGRFVIYLDENYSLTRLMNDPHDGELLSDPIIPTQLRLNVFDPRIAGSYNHSVSLNHLDSLGIAHELSVYFVRQARANTWVAYVLIDGEEVGDPDQSLPWPENELATRASFELVFKADGRLDDELSEEMVISNWWPKTIEGFPSGALGPLNIADGAVLPPPNPAVTSNFIIGVDQLSQTNAPFLNTLDLFGTQLAQQTKTVKLAANLDARENAHNVAVFRVVSNGEAINRPRVSTAGNGYAGTTYTITDPNGVETDIVIPDNASAFAIASAFDKLEGVRATSSNQVDLIFDTRSAPGTWQLSLNGYPLPSNNSKQDIAKAINSETNGKLSGISASDSRWGIAIAADHGVDLNLELSTSFDGYQAMSIGFTGNDYVGLDIFVSYGDAEQVFVGGEFEITLDENYTLSTASTDGALIANPIVPIPLEGRDFNPLMDETYSHVFSARIIDSLFNEHVLTIYFVKTSIANTWDAYVQIDDHDVGDPNLDLEWPASLDPSVARFQLVFNADGSLNKKLSKDLYITNWVPLTEEGAYNGALLPFNKSGGADLPLGDVPSNSNFSIDLGNTTVSDGEFLVKSNSVLGFLRE